MPINEIKPSGPTKASKNDAGGGVLRSEPVIGIVKNNIDAVRQGRIQVFIEDLNGSDPENTNAWVTVSYLSPFYGKTYGDSGGSGYGEFAANPVSYGMWTSPPDIGTRVVCIFINGDPSYGYYIGAIPEPETLATVPCVASTDGDVNIGNTGEAKGLAGATRVPITNINTDNLNVAQTDGFLDETKPVNSYETSILSQQGLIRDNIRGPITSSSQRESPSRVGFGISTPGRPIYEGGANDSDIATAVESGTGSATQVTSRRTGHSIVMDDGDLIGENQLIRIRSSLGHQILMSDDGQCLFVIHANGQSWIELGKEGTIDMFATNSVNIRTQGDLNLHADNDINIHAKNNINLNAKQNLAINTDQEMTVRNGTNFKQHVLSQHSVKVGGTMSIASGGDASVASSAITYINGSKVNLNTGQTSATPQEVKPIPLVAQTDTLFDEEKGFIPAPGKLETITTRTPAHQPWEMANKGVNVTTDLSASSNLPQSPSPEVQAANNAAPSVPNAPVTAAGAATVPDVSGVTGGALNAGTAASMVGAAAASASSVASQAVSAGTSIANGAPQIGQLAQSATQLASAGTLKPGSSTLVNGLVSQGATVSGAMTNNLFTGQGGVGSLNSYVANTTAQVQTQVTNIAGAQSQLTSAGIISPNQSGTAGLINATVQNGIGPVSSFVNTTSGGLSKIAGSNPIGAVSGSLTGLTTGAGGALSGLAGGAAGALGSAASGALGSLGGAADINKLGGAASGIAQGIAQGNFADKLSTQMGPLGGLAGSLTGGAPSLNSAVTGAFDACKNSLKPFDLGKQNIKAVSEKNAAAAAAADASGGIMGNITGALGGAAGGALGGLAGGLPSSLSGATSGLTSGLVGAVKGATSGLPISTSSISSVVSSVPGSSSITGLQGLPGGASSIGAIINNSPTATNTLPGVSAVGNFAKNNVTALTNNIPTSAASLSSTVNSIAGGAGLGSAVGKLTGGSVGGALSGLTGGASSALGGLTSAGGVGSALGGLTSGGGLSSALGGLTSGGALSSALGGLGDPSKMLGSLSSSASSLLPKGMAAQLTSALKALSSNGPVQVKLPIVAQNTVNRSGFTAQMGSIIGNPKIPTPNYNQDSNDVAIEKLKALNAELDAKIKRRKDAKQNFDTQLEITNKAKKDWINKRDTLPEGDPAIAEARAILDAERKKLLEVYDVLKQVAEE